LDIEMPNQDGFITTVKIKELVKSFGMIVPIVGCSGYDNMKVRHNSIKCGMDEYLNKPIAKTSLELILNKYLREN